MGTTNDAVNLILRGEPFRNFCHSFYDEFVEQNVTFRHRAGVKSLIIRRNLGGCCEWCQNLAGIYVYGEEPKDVYRRHDSCRCLVTSKFEGRGYEDVWSKKEFETQKEARITRQKEAFEELIRQDEIRKIEIEYIHESTQNKGEIIYEEGYKKSKHRRESNCAELLHKKYGGTIKLLKEKNKKNEYTPDYEWRGKLWEHKGVSSLNSIDKQVEKGIHQIEKNPGGLIIELSSNNNLSFEEINACIIHRLKRTAKSMKLDVIVIRDNKVISIIRNK